MKDGKSYLQGQLSRPSSRVQTSDPRADLKSPLFDKVAQVDPYEEMKKPP
jgi:hypothetical protein